MNGTNALRKACGQLHLLFVKLFGLIGKKESLYGIIMAYWENFVKGIIANFSNKIGHFILPAQFSGMAGKAPIFLFSGVCYTAFCTREKGAKIRMGGE